jgi:hypothetical protein
MTTVIRVVATGRSKMKKMLALAGLTVALFGALPQPEADARSVTVRSVGVAGGRPVVVNRVYRSGPRYRSGMYFATPVVVGGSCAWLRVKAIDTGSRYWWRRYRECIS